MILDVNHGGQIPHEQVINSIRLLTEKGGAAVGVGPGPSRSNISRPCTPRPPCPCNFRTRPESEDRSAAGVLSAPARLTESSDDPATTSTTAPVTNGLDARHTI